MASTWLAERLGLENPWFATLAAIVAMEITMRASLANARNTLVGAAVGAAAGLALALVAKEEVWAVGLLILAAFAVFGWMHMEPVARQAAVVASVVLLVPERPELSTGRLAFVRFTEAVIGIAVALAVNRWVFPPHAYLDVRRHLARAFDHLAEAWSSALSIAAGRPVPAGAGAGAAAGDNARQGVRAELRAVDELWEEALDERPPPEVLGVHWRAATRRIWEQCAVLLSTAPTVADSSLLDGARPQLDRLASQTAAALREVGRCLAEHRPIPDLPGLEVDRQAVLEAMRRVEQIDAGPPVAETLACFAFVNAMTTVASRLVDLGDPARTADDAGDTPETTRH